MGGHHHHEKGEGEPSDYRIRPPTATQSSSLWGVRSEKKGPDDNPQIVELNWSHSLWLCDATQSGRAVGTPAECG